MAARSAMKPSRFSPGGWARRPNMSRSVAFPRFPRKHGNPSKLFYSLETLGQADRLHWQVYDHFHFENVKLNDEKIMADWVARNGIERQRFVEVYGSSGVAASVAQARELLKAYDVRAVPTFIVDGKFLTSARLAGGTEQVIQVLDHLVRLAREERLRLAPRPAVP